MVVHRLQVHLHPDYVRIPPDVDVHSRPALLHLWGQSTSSRFGRALPVSYSKRTLLPVYIALICIALLPLPPPPSPPTYSFSKGIGDSAQGFTNAILFVCFTKTVRDAFRRVFCLRCKRKNLREFEEGTQINNSQPPKAAAMLESTSSNIATRNSGSLRLKNILDLESSVPVSS